MTSFSGKVPPGKGRKGRRTPHRGPPEDRRQSDLEAERKDGRSLAGRAGPQDRKLVPGGVQRRRPVPAGSREAQGRGVAGTRGGAPARGGAFNQKRGVIL